MIMRKFSKNLVNKSTDAFILAIEMFNKPTINYRTEAFSVFFSNAWELLLKAYLVESNKGKRSIIYYKKERGKRHKSISIEDCLRIVFTDNNSPIRRNIEYIASIRNEATHLIIAELDPFFSRAFQSGVFNYINQINTWFSIDLNLRFNPGFLSLITDRDLLSDTLQLKGKYSKNDLEGIMYWIREFNELSKLGESATISINHTIAIVKNPKNADYVISAGGTGRKNAVVIEKIKDPNITHTYNRTTAIEEIKGRISNSFTFTEYDFEAYVFVKGYKKNNNEYFWKGKYSGAGQYSQKFIDEYIQALNNDPNNIKNWRKQYGKYLKRKKQTIKNDL